MLPSQISYKDLQVRLQTLGCCLGDKTAIYNEALELGKDCGDKLEKLAYAISLYKVIRDYNTDLVLIPAIEGVQEEVAYENQEDGNCITIEQADIIFQYLQDYCKDCFREYGYYDTGILPSNDSGGWVGSSGIYVVSRQIQANWTQTNTDAVDYIKNKSIAGYLESGSNITITGSGTISDPYIISSSGGGGGGSMVYPGAGIPVSTGSAWGTSITNNSSNWNTAYSWGNHASAGYLTDAPSDGKTYGRKNAAWSEVVSTGGVAHGTASGTDTYAVTITGVAAYADGDAYLIRFTNGNTTSATLNINTLGAKSLYRNNDGALIGGDIVDGAEMLCVYNSTLGGFQVIGTAPNTLLGYVTNDDSVTLTKGMPVYAFSGTGDRMTVKRALNTGDSTSAQTVGLVLSSSIAAGQKGLIMIQGLLDGLSILPTSTFADGDAIYLGATAGSITNVKPSAPNHLVYLGVVTTASNGSAGRMYVRVQNGYELEELHDVADANYSTPLDVDSLLIKDDATSLWKKLTWANLKSTLKTYFDTIYQAALGYTAENTANKSSSYTSSSTTTYANTKALVDGLATKQDSLGFTPVTNARTITINSTTYDLSADRTWTVSGLPSGTQGDIIYHNGTNWVVLNAGTSGKFLRTNGALANPSWESQSSVYQNLSISTSATTYTPQINGYRETLITCYGLSSATLTINAPTTTGTLVEGDKLIFRISDNGTLRNLSFDPSTSIYIQRGAAVPASTITINKISTITFLYNATANKWDCVGYVIEY